MQEFFIFAPIIELNMSYLYRDFITFFTARD